jgi:hypothetical protein
MKWKVEGIVFRIIKGIIKFNLMEDFIPNLNNSYDIKTYLMKNISKSYTKELQQFSSNNGNNMSIFLFKSKRGNVFNLYFSGMEIYLIVYNYENGLYLNL